MLPVHTLHHFFKLRMHIRVPDPLAEYKKFVSTDPAEYVIASEKSFQLPGIFADHLITVCMAEYVISQFKIIQVKHDDRSGFLPALHIRQITLDSGYCCLTVKQSGQGIRLSNFSETQFLVFLLCNIQIISHCFYGNAVLITDCLPCRLDPHTLSICFYQWKCTFRAGPKIIFV